jgi:adenylate cyclase
MERRLAAILFTDVVDYTALMARDEAAGRRVRSRHERLVRERVLAFGGQWIEERGDESLSLFHNALDAVHCALAIQARIEGDSELSLRIGIHLGDVTVEGRRVFGDGVNVAARVRPLAEPGGICISQPVRDSIKNQPHLATSSLGARELKGVDDPLEIFRVEATASGFPEAATSGTRAFAAVSAWKAPLLGGAGALALVAALLWLAPWTTAPDAPIRSIAVLPLDDLSDDPEQAYFAFGLTEALIAELAKVRDLRVISRTSVTPYENTTKPLATIAEELGVQAVVEGSILRAGDRVRITAQLIDARSDTHLWAESYERDLADILGLQADVARAIARQIHLEVAPATTPPPIRPEAHEAYLKGYYFQMKRTRADALRAVSYFREAIALDPTSPLAYAALADEYSCAPTHSWGLPDSELWPSVPLEMLARARENALQALALDPDSPAGHNSLAIVRTFADWDWEGAEAAHRRTLGISPSREWNHATYGIFLGFMQRLDEAVHHLEIARSLDPLRIDTIMWLASAHLFRGETELAKTRWREAMEMDPSYPGLLQSVLSSFCGTEDHEEALAAIERGMQTYPDDPLVMGELAYCHAVGGNAATARLLLDEMQALSGVTYVSPVSRAAVHVGLGEIDSAFDALEQAFRDHDPQLLYLGLSPVWQRVADDARHADLMRRIGLPSPAPRQDHATATGGIEPPEEFLFPLGTRPGSLRSTPYRSSTSRLFGLPEVSRCTDAENAHVLARRRGPPAPPRSLGRAPRQVGTIAAPLRLPGVC